LAVCQYRRLNEPPPLVLSQRLSEIPRVETNPLVEEARQVPTVRGDGLSPSSSR
jgi:hypothetical protein